MAIAGVEIQQVRHVRVERRLVEGCDAGGPEHRVVEDDRGQWGHPHRPCTEAAIATTRGLCRHGDEQ